MVHSEEAEDAWITKQMARTRELPRPATCCEKCKPHFPCWVKGICSKPTCSVHRSVAS